MSTRRDFVKWVLYLGATASLPAISSVADIPRDTLEGICRVPKKLADLSGYAPGFIHAENEAFEGSMLSVWREANGTARFVRVHQDLGVQPAYRWQDPETGDWYDEPEAYVSFFQYRRA